VLAVSSADYIVEPATSVKFPKELTVPGCSDSLILLGTGVVLVHCLCFEIYFSMHVYGNIIKHDKLYILL